MSRAWHKVQTDWEAWQKRDLSRDDIVRLILDGTAVRVRLDQRATSLSVLVALGVRRDGQKVLLPRRDSLEEVGEKLFDLPALPPVEIDLHHQCHRARMRNSSAASRPHAQLPQFGFEDG